MKKKQYIYCLEFVADCSSERESEMQKNLDLITMHLNITTVYKSFDCIEGFEESLNTLFFEDKNYNNYSIIYFAFKGRNNEIEIDNYYYTFEEIAELFEGKFKGKLVHFANTFQLDLEDETFQYFIDVTGAKAISGYTNYNSKLITALDLFYFKMYQENQDINQVVQSIDDDKSPLSTIMGFKIYQ